MTQISLCPQPPGNPGILQNPKPMPAAPTPNQKIVVFETPEHFIYSLHALSQLIYEQTLFTSLYC